MVNVDDRELVFPGRSLGEGIRKGVNSFREDKRVLSAVDGMARVRGNNVNVIPFRGTYTPKGSDVIIGVVSNVLRGGWLVNLNSSSKGYMMGEEATKEVLNSDLSEYFGVGDVISAKISEVDELKSPQLIRPWKLKGGLTIDVNPKKIPRVVGKKRSMLNMIKEKSGCKIVVGQNGRIWLKGNNMDIAIKAVRKIEKEAQSRGLTNRVDEFLSKELDSR